MSPKVGRWTFIIATIAAPSVLTILLEVQRQLDNRALDWWTLASAGTGAVMSLIVAVFNIQRASTEKAESDKEVRTNLDADADNRVEQPEGGPPVLWAQATNHADAVITSFPVPPPDTSGPGDGV